ncbi:MAG TPA: hypothetical protein PK216_14955, partial [Aquimonas sp.]|nr:hypothetical protein [Aquimonas sp.]
PMRCRWLQPLLESVLAKTTESRLDNTQQLLTALQASVSSSPEAEALRGYSEAAQVRYTSRISALPARRTVWLWMLLVLMCLALGLVWQRTVS